MLCKGEIQYWAQARVGTRPRPGRRASGKSTSQGRHDQEVDGLLTVGTFEPAWEVAPGSHPG